MHIFSKKVKNSPPGGGEFGLGVEYAVFDIQHTTNAGT